MTDDKKEFMGFMDKMYDTCKHEITESFESKNPVPMLENMDRLGKGIEVGDVNCGLELYTSLHIMNKIQNGEN